MYKPWPQGGGTAFTSWYWINSQPGALSAPWGSRMPVILSSYSHRAQGLLGDHRRTSGGSTGMCQGLSWKPWVLSWRGKEQRGVQSPVPHPDPTADCPQPHLHTLFQHRPHSDDVRRAAWMRPATPTPMGRAGAAAGLWGAAHGPTSHTRPQLSTLATLDKESPCLGPFPKSTGKLTASQGCNGHLGKLVMRWTHRAQEGMTHRCSTVKSLEKLA